MMGVLFLWLFDTAPQKRCQLRMRRMEAGVSGSIQISSLLVSGLSRIASMSSWTDACALAGSGPAWPS